MEFITYETKITPKNPVVNKGRYQCWGCKHREGFSEKGVPICSVDGGIVLSFVYQPCDRFEASDDRC